MSHTTPRLPSIKPVKYLRMPSTLFGYVYIEVSSERSNIGSRVNQLRNDFSYCIDKAGLGDIPKFRQEAR
jgi:hypothetical protein